MSTLTHLNQSTYGYDGGVLNTKRKENTFTWNQARATRQWGTFQEECYEVARIITAEAGSRVPTVLLSGGLDSEVVCRSFLDQGLPVQAVSFKYDDGSLEHETAFIDKFISSTKIQHRYDERDWYSWALEEGRRYFEESEHTISVTLPRVFLAEQIWNDGGYPIAGIDILYERSGDAWVATCTEKEMTPLYKYSAKYGIHGAYLFFAHTPEIVGSFLSEPEILTLVKGEDPLSQKFRLRHTSVKYAMYKRYWPDIILRPKITHYQRQKSKFDAIDAELNRGRRLRFNDEWHMECLQFLDGIKPNHVC